MKPKSKKMTIAIIACVALIIIGAGYLWYIFFSGRSNPQLDTDKLTIGANTWTVEIASTTTEKALGLSGRDGLGASDGMLFLFDEAGTQNFWMKDMKFPLDMIWIANDKVVGFAQDAEPQPGAAIWALKIYTSPDTVDKVLEVNAGTVAKDSIAIGDTVTIGPSQ